MMSEDLPTGWEIVILEQVVDILDSQRIPVNNTEREKRLANAKHFYPYYGATGQVGEIDDYIFEGESILLGEDAAPFLDFGKDKAYIANGKFWVNNHAHILRGRSGIDNRFLCQQLNVFNYRSFVSGTTRLKLTQGSMKNMPLKIAPLNEQKRIVDRIEQLFSDMDKGEELLKTVQKQLNTYRQSVLKAAVTGELTKDWRKKNKKKLESGEKLLARILESRRKNWKGRGQYKEAISANLERMPEIPEGWVWCSLGQLTSFITSGSRGWAEYYSESGAYFFRSQNVTKAGLSMDDIAYVNPPQNSEGERTKLCSGDLLVSITGNPGNVALIPELDAEAYISQHVCLARPVDIKTASYLEIIIRSWPIQKYFERVQYGLTKPGLNLTQVAECPIPLPSKPEQEEIIARIEDVFSKIDVCEALCAAELSRSRTLRQSILKSAFSGKLVAQDPSDEPASELLARIKSGDGVKTKAKAAPPRRGRKPRSDKSEAA
ncbi:restriction endonuclease subunit S [Micavibrio aeruginosavorus]|uniref:restriction endonuclease subunit S n=1 Tax=Micavibrio aeruginosavorus TaxID=349221 RepID=UPI003F4AC67D